MKHIVQPGEEGKLLRVLRGPMRVSWSAVKSAKWAGRILVNGSPAPVDRIVRPGDEVAYLEADPVLPAPLPCGLPLNIRYEDDCLAVVEKPAPMAVQCGKGLLADTLENVWYSHLGQPDPFVYRPVNRLDKGTSGLMVIAKTAHAQNLLQRQLHTEHFIREYEAVTEGVPHPPSGVIDLPIAKEDAASVRRVVSARGRPCRTHYLLLAAAAGRALLQLRLDTGRTHQIRVHLQALGCPVCGDFLYGAELACLPGRFALHSAYLALTHPYSGERLRFQSPLPDDLAALLPVQTAGQPFQPLFPEGSQP